MSTKLEARLRLLEAELRELAARVAGLSEELQRGLTRVEALRREIPSQ